MGIKSEFSSLKVRPLFSIWLMQVAIRSQSNQRVLVAWVGRGEGAVENLFPKKPFLLAAAADIGRNWPFWSPASSTKNVGEGKEGRGDTEYVLLGDYWNRSKAEQRRAFEGIPSAQQQDIPLRAVPTLRLGSCFNKLRGSVPRDLAVELTQPSVSSITLCMLVLQLPI